MGRRGQLAYRSTSHPISASNAVFLCVLCVCGVVVLGLCR